MAAPRGRAEAAGRPRAPRPPERARNYRGQPRICRAPGGRGGGVVVVCGDVPRGRRRGGAGRREAAGQSVAGGGVVVAGLSAGVEGAPWASRG